ncbi:MAG TPA: PQQ-dependent sugar dehydrogenase, partial [Myxococcales bacterium]|nr:PQQ-dependent sugar dehydrogenase [Myxococcales bacterium]
MQALLLLAAATTAGGAWAADQCELVEKGYGAEGKAAVRLETVVSGLEVPWGIGFLPGGEALVTERPGRLRLVPALTRRKAGDGTKLPVVATLAVDAEEEGGLLGIAVHPRFEQNRFVYLYLTVKEGGRKSNRVERWRLAEDLGSARFDKRIVQGIPSAAYHDGGRLRFGPDGMLYVGTGDGREPDRSQDPRSLGGKVLRLTPDGEIPSDNPMAGNPLYLLGVRNTQGFDWSGGRFYVTDHGPSGELGRSGHDEVNLASPGANLGWPAIYGCQTRAGMVAPSLSWETAVPPGGASFYTGTAIPGWRGSLLVGTLRSKHLHRVKFSAADPSVVELHEVYFRDQAGRLRDVVMGPDGAVYVTTSNCDGRGECPPDRDKILRLL